MEREEIARMNPLSLAFAGDAAEALRVKSRLVLENDVSSHVMQNLSVRYLCCEAQAKAAQEVFDSLTEEEQAVFRRARNARVSTVPKHATPADYHLAPAIEAVLGFLYLAGDVARCEELIDRMCGFTDGKEGFPCRVLNRM